MGKEDVRNLLRLDVDSSRVVAAMKVTGITLDDLDPEKFTLVGGETPRKGEERQKRRMELFERKRRMLARELEMTAETLDEAYVETITSPRADSINTTEARSLLNMARDKVDQQRDKSRDKIRQYLSKQVERKYAYTASLTVKEEPQKRSPEAEKEYQEDMKRKKEIEDKVKQQRIERENHEGEKIKIKQRETQQMLREEAARIAKFQEEKRQYAEEIRKMNAEGDNRLSAREQMIEEKIIGKTRALTQRGQGLEGRLNMLEEERLQRSEDLRARYSSKQDFVKEQLDKQKQTREEAYMKALEKNEKAREKRIEKAEDLTAKVKEKREKDLTRLQLNQQKRKAERRDFVKKVRMSMKEGAQKRQENREAYQQETIGKQADIQAAYKELVQRNLARITRSDAWSREQTLEKIQATAARIDGIMEERKAIIDYKQAAQRDGMLERTKANELLHVMSSSNSSRINKALLALDMPLLSEPAPKEGDEAEEGKK